MGHQATSDIISQLSRTLGFRQTTEVTTRKQTNRYGRVLFGKTSVSPKRGERGDKTSQQKLQQEANKPIRKSPIRQDISTTKRGERGDKISQQKLQQEANEPIRKSPIRKRSTKTLDDERYHIPNVKDFGTSTGDGNTAKKQEKKRDRSQTRIGCS